MDNMVENTSNRVQEESSFDFKKLISSCLKNWYWFVISVGLCCCLGLYKVLSTPPQYNRQAILLIKESNIRRTSSSEVEAMLTQAGQMPSKLSNEIVVLQAPSLMQEAVNRLDLTVDYSLKGRLRNSVIYSAAVPVVADFEDVPDEVFVNMTIVPSGEGVLIKDVVYSQKGHKNKLSGHIKAEFDKEVVFPFGKVVLKKNPYHYSETKWEKPEIITKRSLASTTSKYLGKFSVSTQESKQRLSDILVLSLTDYSINRADDLINMIITVYNEKWVIENNKMATANSEFISDRLAAIEAELNRVDNTITNYKSKNKMASVDEASKIYTSQASEIARQIRDLESQLSVAKYLKNFLATVDGNSLIPQPSGINASSIASQVNEYNDILLKRKSLISISSEKNPLVVDMGESLSAMRGAIITSIDNLVVTLEEQISFAVKQQTRTEDMIAQNPTQALDLVKYERVQKVQESLYMFLLQKREENELSQAFSAYNTRIVNPPYGSSVPVSPRKMRTLLIAFVLGLCIPAGVIFLLINFDTKIRNKKDVEGIRAPFLGEIPHNRTENEPKGLLHKVLHRPIVSNDNVNCVVVKKGSRDIINEAFRITRANLEFVCKGTDEKVIMVTSMHPGSGKTFINLNLTSALAINGKKILVVDCDFRRRTLSSFLKLKHKGFADYLALPSGDIKDYVVKGVMYDTMDVLPVGTLPPNPSELLTRPEFAKTIESLKAEYDFIFLDCPPVDIVADTQIVAPIADRTLFVIRAGLFDKREIVEINKMIAAKKYNTVSIILNDTMEYSGGHYGSNSYAYKKRYYVGKGN